jgi:hypothetical protein
VSEALLGDGAHDHQVLVLAGHGRPRCCGRACQRCRDSPVNITIRYRSTMTRLTGQRSHGKPPVNHVNDVVNPDTTTGALRTSTRARARQLTAS